MDEGIQDWLDEAIKNYAFCMRAVENQCVKLNLTPEEKRTITSNIYIQANKAGVFRTEGDPGPPRDSQDDTPATDKQLDFINTLCRELGKEADEVVDQQLRLCGKAHLTALTKQEATEIITILKAEKKKSK